jgi:uncharacterized protein with FMN-binding domain
MKKVFVGGVLLFVFGGYILYQKMFGVPDTASGIVGSGGVTSNAKSGTYKDGTYTGSVADAYYGNVQVQATIQGGKISNVNFLQHPNEAGHSILVNAYAMPLLSSEAIQAQNANVNAVSGATATSQAFVQSLSSALSQAK